MMGSSNGITRGQLRPHFSGRSPPFLVAALCVGLGILGVSYWSLCSQYNDLEVQLKKALQRIETLEKDKNLIQTQLESREGEFSQVKKTIQKTDQELIEANNQLKTRADEINSINSKINSLKETNAKCNEDLIKKENELGDAMTKLKDTEEQKDKLTQLQEDQNKELNRVKLENERLEELRKQLNINNTSHTISSLSPVANVGQPPNIENNVLSSDKIVNNVLKKPIEENKEMQKSQAEAPNEVAVADNNAENAFSVKQQESVIAEPNRMSPLNPSAAGLGEEDKKVDGLVDAPVANEIPDENQNKDEEESKDKQL